MCLSRQLYEEALHVQFYLTLLDSYVPDPEDVHARPRGWSYSSSPRRWRP